LAAHTACSILVVACEQSTLEPELLLAVVLVLEAPPVDVLDPPAAPPPEPVVEEDDEQAPATSRINEPAKTGKLRRSKRM
jgi:hypothetical protein